MSRLDDHDWTGFTVDDRLLLGVGDWDAECIAVETAQDLRRMCAEVLGSRERPVVGIALEEHCEPALCCGDVRGVVGPDVHIYLLSNEEVLEEMRELLGRELAIGPGMARIWWPGAGPGCVAGDHPTVLVLEGEPSEVTLEELALQYDLSRPRVRGEIRLIEDARAFLECELATAREQNRRVHERLRDAQIESHSQRIRAEAAEASLAAQRPPGLDLR